MRSLFSRAARVLRRAARGPGEQAPACPRGEYSNTLWYNRRGQGAPATRWPTSASLSRRFAGAPADADPPHSTDPEDGPRHVDEIFHRKGISYPSRMITSGNRGR